MEIISVLLMKKFNVCKNHQKTGGYESCCFCGPDKDDICTEAIEIKRLKKLYEKKNKIKKA